jgi:hypothetical protein
LTISSGANFPQSSVQWFHAGTRPPKNGINARLSVCGRFEVKIISAPASSLSRARGPKQIGGAARDRRRGIDPADHYGDRITVTVH